MVLNNASGYRLITLLKRVVQGEGGEGGKGGVTGTVREPKKQRLTDHGNENFIFPSHENKQEINSF